MPRQRRGAATPARNAPSRPMAAPARLNIMPAQQRPASTTAHPPATQQSQGSQGSGLLGNFASTAAGVAVGSSIGHAIGGLFGGGSNQAAGAQQSDSALTSQTTDGTYQSSGYAGSCDESAKALTRCLDDNKGEYQMNICGWYLDQLKACQVAANKY